MVHEIRIGTAGWSLPADARDRFGDGTSLLARYATRFSGVEINSTFYRRHQPKTFERWAQATPPGFRFAVKAPKTITHDARLNSATEALEHFLQDAGGLGAKLGPLLFQLPPSLTFDADTAERFIGTLRIRFAGEVAWEPRHVSWFAPAASDLLHRNQIARVAADPAPAPSADAPAGWSQLAYWRLHGSPVMYSSPYDHEDIQTLSQRVAATDAAHTWVVFDNTALGAATRNALAMTAQVPLAASAPTS